MCSSDLIKSHSLFRRHDGAEAKRFFIQGAIALADHHNGAGGLLRGDGISNERVNSGPFDSVLIGRLANQNLAQGGDQAKSRRHHRE